MQSLLKEIHDSISLVETNRTDNNLSKIEKTKLEETLMTLTNMERTIINETNTNMLSKLSASTPALTELINDMASSTEKLDELNSKLRKIINIINFYYLQIECPNSGLADPVLSGVNDCLSWFAYGQSIGQNIQNWCSNSSIATKCCLTCNSN